MGDGGNAGSGSATDRNSQNNINQTNRANNALGNSEQNRTYSAPAVPAAPAPAAQGPVTMRMALDQINAVDQANVAQANNYGLGTRESQQAINMFQSPVSMGSEYGGLLDNGMTQGQMAGIEEDIPQQLANRKLVRKGVTGAAGLLEGLLSPSKGLLTTFGNKIFAPKTEEELRQQAIQDQLNEWSGASFDSGTPYDPRANQHDNPSGENSNNQYGAGQYAGGGTMQNGLFNSGGSAGGNVSGNVGGNAIGAGSGSISDQIMNMTSNLRKNYVGGLEDFTQGNFNIADHPMWAGGRSAIGDQYQVAKDNIIGNTPTGGSLNESLGNLEGARAKDLTGLISQIQQDMLNRTQQTAFGTVPSAISAQTSLAGNQTSLANNAAAQYGANYRQSELMDAQEEAANNAMMMETGIALAGMFSDK